MQLKVKLTTSIDLRQFRGLSTLKVYLNLLTCFDAAILVSDSENHKHRFHTVIAYGRYGPMGQLRDRHTLTYLIQLPRHSIWQPEVSKSGHT